MRICVLFGPWSLHYRKTLDFPYRDDPRGLSGSEMCVVRLHEELSSQTTLFTVSEKPRNFWLPWEARTEQEFDIAIAVNEPDALRGVKAKARVCYQLLNDFSYCEPGFAEHVDLWVSCSEPHLEYVRTRENAPSGPWDVVPLGCDPERYEETSSKVPGRVVYTSSPDRGLHWLLQEWPKIRRAVPHAHLRIFYRVLDWIRGFDATPYYPPIEPLRQRALYIEEALKRLDGHGIELIGPVSRARLERELCEAEVLAYPMDTTSWSEGFSCSTLEACAARACPITTDADAFRGIYGEALPLVERAGDWVPRWSDRVIRALTDSAFREQVNDKAEAFARRHTWKQTATRILDLAKARL